MSQKFDALLQMNANLSSVPAATVRTLLFSALPVGATTAEDELSGLVGVFPVVFEAEVSPPQPPSETMSAAVIPRRNVCVMSRFPRCSRSSLDVRHPTVRVDVRLRFDGDEE